MSRQPQNKYVLDEAFLKRVKEYIDNLGYRASPRVIKTYKKMLAAYDSYKEVGIEPNRSQIAERLGISRQAVLNYVKNMNLRMAPISKDELNEMIRWFLTDEDLLQHRETVREPRFSHYYLSSSPLHKKFNAKFGKQYGKYLPSASRAFDEWLYEHGTYTPVLGLGMAYVFDKKRPRFPPLPTNDQHSNVDK